MGEATKTVPYVMEGDKAYRFTLRWGQATATDDTEGAVTAVSDRRPEEADIQAVLPRFRGVIDQVPPIYSAIKISGQRAYDRARAQEVFKLDPRPVTIHSLELVGREGPDLASFEVRCGKGAYMRALARDLGAALGCYAHVVERRRTGAGPAPGPLPRTMRFRWNPWKP